MTTNKWNDLLLNHGYKTVEEYVELWNDSGDDKVDLANFTKPDVKEFIEKNKKGLSSQFRSFVFTIHKPYLYYESLDELESMIKSWKGVDKSIFSIEVGKYGRTLHIQGYVKMKTPVKKATIIKKLNNTHIHIERTKGSIKQNYKYITKKEEGIDNKIIRYTGDWNIGRIERKDLSISEFADYAVDNNLLLTQDNIDKYCIDFRRNPSALTIHKISSLINIRRSKKRISDIKPIQTLVIFGNSGNGKSLISEWLFDQVNMPLELIFKKAAADKASENDWWSKDNILQNQAFFTEVDITFPKKRYLLSFLDAKDKLAVKGSDAIINNFKHLIINATATSMRYIYNATQNKKSFTEIYRRLLNGYFIYVEANPLWSKVDNIDSLTNGEMMDLYPPKIYLLKTKEQSKLGSKTWTLYNSNYRLEDAKDYELMNRFTINNKKSNWSQDEDSSKLYLHEHIKDNDFGEIVEEIEEITKEDLLKIYKKQLSKTDLKTML